MMVARVSSKAFLVGVLVAPAPGASAIALGTRCKNDGASAQYAESLSGEGAAMTRTAASDTGCPNHVNYAINPNSARFKATSATMPAYPYLQGSSETTDLSEAPGNVGIMFNGVSVFSSFADMGAATEYENGAVYLEGDTFDLCGGHATTQGWYHYHSTAGCLQEQAMEAAGTTGDDHSPQLGWSYDGFPIYGQLGPGGVEMLPCGKTGADVTYCLDDCNGYEGEIDGVDGFTYRYYLSCGFNADYFPHTTNCYRGCCPDSQTCESLVEGCSSSATAGYTSDYTPVGSTPLDTNYESSLIVGEDIAQIDLGSSLNCSLFQGLTAVAAHGDKEGNEDNDDAVGAASAQTLLSTKLALLTLAAAAAHTLRL